VLGPQAALRAESACHRRPGVLWLQARSLAAIAPEPAALPPVPSSLSVADPLVACW